MNDAKKVEEEEDDIKQELYQCIKIHAINLALFYKNFTLFEKELSEYAKEFKRYLENLKNRVTKECKVDCRDFKISDRFIIIGRMILFIKSIYFTMMEDFCENIVAYNEAVVLYKIDIYKYNTVVVNKIRQLYRPQRTF